MPNLLYEAFQKPYTTCGHLCQASQKTGPAIATVVIAIFLGRIIYLLCFHPYAKYPGPKLAALSDWWWAYHWLRGRFPWAVEKAFREYGDVVRIAPNEIAIFPFEAHQAILLGTEKGTGTFLKTNLHPVFVPEERGLFAEIDVDKHSTTKQMLSRGFSVKAHQKQDMAMHSIIDTFVSQMEARSAQGDILDMTLWCNWLAADLIGELSAGHSFDNIQGEATTLMQNFTPSAPFTNIQYLLPRFPVLAPFVAPLIPRKEVQAILEELQGVYKQRKAMSGHLSHDDFLSPLVSNGSFSDDFIFAQYLAMLIPLEAVSALMLSMMIQLGMHPEKQCRLRREINSHFTQYDQIESQALQNVPWLNAVLKESLRYHTIATMPHGRVSPGATIGGVYVPKGYRVQSSAFSMWRSERYFTDAREYHPERWLQASHEDYDRRYVHDRREIFFPFSMGQRKCLGFVTADRQARAFIAKMVWKFEWEIANSHDFDWDRDLKVFQITVKPKVSIRLKSLG